MSARRADRVSVLMECVRIVWVVITVSVMLDMSSHPMVHSVSVCIYGNLTFCHQAFISEWLRGFWDLEVDMVSGLDILRGGKVIWTK